MKYILLLFAFVFSLSCYGAENTYKVLRVIDGDTVYLDFNNDGYIQKDERVRLNGIDTFEVKPSEGLEWQMNIYGFNEKEALGLAYMAKEFAKEKLNGKYVKAVYSADTKRCTRGRHLMSIYYKDEDGHYKNYEKEILKSGLAVIYSKSNLAKGLKRSENLSKLRKNAELTRNFELVILDKRNKIYYETGCPYAQSHGYFELVNKNDYSGQIKPAVCPSK